jgi:hypothetical protein
MHFLCCPDALGEPQRRHVPAQLAIAATPLK